MGTYHQPQAEPWDMQEHPVEQLEMAHKEFFNVIWALAQEAQRWSPFEQAALQKMQWKHLFTQVTDHEKQACALQTIANLSIQIRNRYTREMEFPQFPISQAYVHAAFNHLTPRFARTKADLLARGMDAIIQHRLRLFQPGSHHNVGGEVMVLTRDDAEALRLDCLKLYEPLRTWYDLAIRRSLPLNNQPIVG